MTQAATMNPGPHHEPPSSMALRFRLLGDFAMILGGEPVTPPLHHTQGLLAALLWYPRPQRRDRLAELPGPVRHLVEQAVPDERQP